MALWIVLATAATVVAVLVALNPASHQPSVERRIEHLYEVDDPQFARAMGSLLGPALLGANRIAPLRNGDRIFTDTWSTPPGAA